MMKTLEEERGSEMRTGVRWGHWPALPPGGETLNVLCIFQGFQSA